MRTAKRLSATMTTASSAVTSPPPLGRERGGAVTSPVPFSNNNGQANDQNGGSDDAPGCDVRLLFVSGTGLAGTTGTRGDNRGADEEDGVTRGLRGDGAPADMWQALGRELWRPWPQADVVVHTGSQVSYSSYEGNIG